MMIVDVSSESFGAKLGKAESVGVGGLGNCYCRYMDAWKSVIYVASTPRIRPLVPFSLGASGVVSRFCVEKV